MSRRILYVAAEKDPLHLHALRNRFLRTPNVVVQRIDPEVPADFAAMDGCFDTVLCLNVLEYLADPAAALALPARYAQAGRAHHCAGAARARGCSAASTAAWDTSGATSAEAARQVVESQGFEIERIWGFNKAGAPPWWMYSKLAGSRRINKLTLKIFDKTVWIWRRMDGSHAMARPFADSGGL